MFKVERDRKNCATQTCVSLLRYLYYQFLRVSIKKSIFLEARKWSPQVTPDTILRMCRYWLNQKVIDMDLPVTVKLEVTQADPGLKGDTAQGMFCCHPSFCVKS
jgi:hypothetical protein